MAELNRVKRLLPVPYKRVWGSMHLGPWFPDSPEKIGEMWFREPESAVLVKFLFATENLSVQVHPDDRLAQQSGHPRGKTEMWHILDAQPGGKIALGFHSPVTGEQVRRAAADGSIMGLLRWIPVYPGQNWFIPAGAVHAIGAGVTLCEVQQNSDLTYRLFDYGRGRELHLEESLRAMNLAFEPDEPRTGAGLQVDCPYFEVTRIDLDGVATAEAASLIIVLSGAGYLNGEAFHQGEVYAGLLAAPLQLTGQARILTVTTRT